MNDKNYAEFTVSRTPSVFAVLFCSAVVLCLAAVSYIIWQIIWILGAAFSLISIALFIYLILPRTKIAYEYTISNGVWRLVVIQGGKNRTNILEAPLEWIESLEPFSKEALRAKKGMDITDFRRSRRQNDEVYIVTLKSEGDTKVVLFRATPKALEIINSYLNE